jgi:hypothetical protein
MIKAILKEAYHRYLPDKLFLKNYYYRLFHEKLDLNDPKTFNAKLQWLKLYDRNPFYTTLVDKYEVKKYVGDMIGEEFVIPTLGVWDKFDDIDFDKLPEQFVLKCTHDSGGIVIVKEKEKLDKQKAKEKLENSLKKNFYYVGREWPYKNVQPRIIAEEYLVDDSGTELRDYKLFNFDGETKLIQYDYVRFTNHKRKLYSEDWEFINEKLTYDNEPEQVIDKPAALNTMKNMARILSDGISFVRTDFYCIDDKVLFGELTLYPGSGFEKFSNITFDYKLGEWLKLPKGGVISNGNIIIYIRPAVDDLLCNSLRDYKLMCFNGKVKCSFVCSERFSDEGLKVTFFDNDWKVMPFERSHPCSKVPISKPNSFDLMIKLAETLAKDIPFVRVDFYEVGGKPFFGELTLYPGDGFEAFQPVEWDYKLGEWLKLPEKRI